MTGPAHCTKRMGRSSRCVKWLTLSRPSSPSRRGRPSCGNRAEDEKNCVSEGQCYYNIRRTIPQCDPLALHCRISDSCIDNILVLEVVTSILYP